MSGLVKFLGLVLFAVLATQCTCQDDDWESSTDWPSEPWSPYPVECNFGETFGKTCLNCTSTVVCTPFGGIARNCWNPKKPYCYRGHCSAKISDECSAQLEDFSPETHFG
ncbi:hypothetical protein EVAR_16667_1 [Eumeta japonica]|uniref:Uncharacterized protein n=1 Tax=Eumeta variegata TaxID=151549 RepID=A0A4C1V0X5_EUMVA|nr:hypothetical protein EVAR_16667_1 [Eumeta japonica]